MLIIIVFCVFLNFIEFYILNPVGITRRTARWLLINCLAVLLFGDAPRMGSPDKRCGR